MRRFLLRVILLFGIVFAFDRGLGSIFEYVANHIKVGSQGKDNYICDSASEDILIFGSSRAVHHYNAKLIEDSLGMSCFNCGEEGNGIILDYGRLIMNLKRHQPKIIIVDISQGFDIEKNDNHKYLGWLKSRYDYDGIKDIFEDVDKTEKYKMLSMIYRYNSRYLQNLFVYFTGKANSSAIKGYVPKNGRIDKMLIRKNPVNEQCLIEVDSLKICYLRKFIHACKDTKLFFVVSPIYYGASEKQYEPVYKICRQQNIPFFFFANDAKYVGCEDYFKDGTHMNSVGADEFTRDLISKLKTLNN